MATLKKTKNWINAGQKYCRMLEGELSALLFTFIKLQFVIKIFVLFIVEWPFYTGFTELREISYNFQCILLILCRYVTDILKMHNDKRNICINFTIFLTLIAILGHYII